MRILITCIAAVLLGSCLQSGHAQTSDRESTAAVAVVERFHAALRSGDSTLAGALLAPDAVVLEGGDLETRQQYLAHHLAEDIKFARSMTSRRSGVTTKVNGAVAWVTSVSATQGEFNGKPLSLVGTELVVLTKAEDTWLIRAIHWLSRQKK